MWHKIKNLFILLVVVLVFSCIYSHFRIDVTKYDVLSNKLTEDFNGFKILQLSDLHNRNISDRIMNVLNEEKPDIVVMTGDMVNYDTENYEQFFNLCDMITQDYKTYFSLGNHEKNIDDLKYTRLIDGIKENGVTVLNDESVVIEKGSSVINLYGLWYDETLSSVSYFNARLESILGELNKNEYNILLAHNPEFFDLYSNWGSDLILSGHVHGGIFRLPFVGGMLSPDSTFFPKYSAGLYESESSKMIVSRGLGYSAIPVRAFNPFEIGVITLRSI